MLCIFSSVLQNKNYRFDLPIAAKQHKISLMCPLCAFTVPAPVPELPVVRLFRQGHFLPLPLRLGTAQQCIDKTLLKERL